MHKPTSSRILALIFSATLIAACGGGGGGGGGGGEAASSGSAPSAPPASGDTSTSPPNTSGQVAKPGKPAENQSGQVEGGTVELTWTAPTTREDGSPLALSEIQGYEIYFFEDGSTPEKGSTQRVSGGTTTRAKVTVPHAGTYFFAVAAVDHEGLVSDLSNYVTVELR